MKNKGMRLHQGHVQLMQKHATKQLRNRQKIQSHEFKLKQHAKKWDLNIVKSDCVGKGGGWNECKSDSDAESDGSYSSAAESEYETDAVSQSDVDMTSK